jgi:hypothetical protein
LALVVLSGLAASTALNLLVLPIMDVGFLDPPGLPDTPSASTLTVVTLSAAQGLNPRAHRDASLRSA